MLTLDQLHLQQGTFELRAHMKIAPATITAIIGPSGGGKSTLMSAIAGFLPPQSGAILWGDASLANLAPGERPVSMLFQDNNLFPHLSVHRNVGLGLGSKRLNHAQTARVEQVLDQVGLAKEMHRKPGALSGGQQSRAALARILLQDRPLVLLDEPFAALGPGLKSEMLALSVDMLQQAGRTLIMVTHDPDDAQQVAENVVFVEGGIADPPITTAEFFGSTDPRYQSYLG